MTARSIGVIALLRYIHTHEVFIEHLRKCDARYLAPLLRASLIGRVGRQVKTTAAGEDVLRGYGSTAMPKRQVENDLTEHCRNLLHAARLRRVA